MENTIISQADAVQFVYGKYLKKDYIVNRKYQRKLVWTLQEKQAFIDSLMRKYSVPLFLFAVEEKDGKEKWEIIDGLQRMNAICSFIENEFPIEVEGKDLYFDLDTLADSLQLKKEGILKQRMPILDKSVCRDIVNYQLPISIIKADSKSVETVFRRINSFGRQLSPQEIRLAGAVGKFPDLVRLISSAIRGDVSSSDKLPLNSMAQISISSEKLKYVIKLDNIFWVKNHIISPDNMRKSRDEELVSQLLAYILLGPNVPPSMRTLDELYQYEENTGWYEKINDAIDKIGFEKLRDSILDIQSTLKLVAEEAKRPLRELLYMGDKPEGLFRSFQILFLTLYELKIGEGLRKVDIRKLTQLLEGLGKSEFSAIGSFTEWNANFRKKKIAAVKGIIKEAFSKAHTNDIGQENGIQTLDNLLTLARTEGNQYDFKQTCHDLGNGQFSQDLVKKVVKTLIAGANKPNSTAYVILGVADNQESAKTHKRHYGSVYKVSTNGSYYITGVEGEVNKYHSGKYDTYQERIKAVIKKSEIDDAVRLQILQNMKQISYYDHEVIIFSLQSGKEPYSYEDQYYVRHGNSCKVVSGVKESKALEAQFKAQESS